MRKILIFFFITIFLFCQNKIAFAQINNSIIITVGDNPITKIDLLKEIKLIAILSNTQIDTKNREQIKGLAIKSLIKRNIKEVEIKKRNISQYNRNQLKAILKNTSMKLGLEVSGLKEILERNNLSYENLEDRFKTDLKWNFMIFQIYKNKISLNTAEVEDKIKLRLEDLNNKGDQEKVDLIKETIVNEEKEKKLKMFSNLHFSNLERSIQINFL